MRDLTTKQRAVLDVITSWQIEHECSPTLKEIRAHLGLHSDNYLLRCLSALEKHGHLAHHPTKHHRTLRFTLEARRQLAQRWTSPAVRFLAAALHTSGVIGEPTARASLAT